MAKKWIGGESVVPTILRLLLYTLVVLGFTLSLPLVVQQTDITVFRENGPVEWLQFALLAGAGGIFLAGSSALPRFRALLLLFLCACWFAAIRELDALLDQFVPIVGWKISFLILPFAAVIVWAHREALGEQIGWFIGRRACGLLWAGFVIAVPFAQLLGHGAFLQQLMGDDYVRYYKTVVEESGELFGYFLVFAGSLESIVQMKAAERSADAGVSSLVGGESDPAAAM